ncbi:MAG: thioredoxin family protein [Dehalococcoidia bacterium]
MTHAVESVITSERYQKGKSYEEYIESGIRNRDLFDMNYAGLEIPADRAARLKALAARPNGPHHMLVIGEDWCPDVYRGMPVSQRIAEAMGIENRVFERDQNKDMIAEFLNGGEFESIPVIVFYDKDHRELGHFIERPKLANEQIHVTREVIGDTSPEAIAKRLGHEPSEDEIKQARAEARQRYLDWQKGEMWASWRVATVDDVIDVLEAATT